jgi:hypothetical protein
MGAVLALSACTAAVHDGGSSTGGHAAPAAPAVTRRFRPGTEPFQALVNDAHARFAGVTRRQERRLHPDPRDHPVRALRRRDRDPRRHVYTAGDVDYRFSIQSVSKPFTAALVMQQYGGPRSSPRRSASSRPGCRSTRSSRSRSTRRLGEPLVNAGAIAAVSLVKAKDEKERWQHVLATSRGFAGEKLPMLEKVYDSEYTTASATAASRTCSSTGSASTPSPRGAARLHPGMLGRRQHVDLALMAPRSPTAA